MRQIGLRTIPDETCDLERAFYGKLPMAEHMCGGPYSNWGWALRQGLVTQEQHDAAEAAYGEELWRHVGH